ncbi:Hsp20/alpha crystallin family protein [Mycolicibacterium palauense]|uniref:Hsp20/alpha crystallin family protein n=1 Tax=Mycolicibacterium palauense TaxID=2034511 RepID=UPI000BFEC4BD|nr:HSP20 family small heat-shock protein [Mycolicibacterium palauense]
MSTLERRQHSSLFPEVADFFAGFPSFANLRPLIDARAMRLEDEMTEDGRYEVRAEIPGVDPAKDVDVTVQDGRLTIKAERSEKSESKGRSEFSYGSFVRSVTLPQGADEEDIKATYDKGILTVSVGISEPKKSEKKIEVQAPQ